MDDILYSGVIPSANLCFTYALTTAVANHGVLTHQCDPVAAHLFTRALTAGVCCAPLLRDDERFAMHWTYDGAIRSLTVEVSPDGHVRGIVGEPQVMPLVEREAQIYGDSGKLSVVRTGHQRVIAGGTVEAGMMDVVDDLALYFCMSDQIETAITALVAFASDPQQPVRLSQGFLLRALPDCDYEYLDKLRLRMHDDSFRACLGQPPVGDDPLAPLLRHLTCDALPPDTTYAPGPTPAYACRCTRETSFTALLTLTPDDLRAAIAAATPLVIRCQYCRQAYTFDTATLATLLPSA